HRNAAPFCHPRPALDAEMGGDLALLRHCLEVGIRKFLRILHEPADAQAIVGKAARSSAGYSAEFGSKWWFGQKCGEISFSVSWLVGSPLSPISLSPPIINQPVFCTLRACLMVKGVATSHATTSTAMATRNWGKPDQ